MSPFASRARELEECIHAWTLQVSGLRGAALIDERGLVLVSTLQARGLEEGLAAFAATAFVSTQRAQRDIGLGPAVFLHLAGRDRQLFVVPVSSDVVLLAITDSAVAAVAITPHLLGLARELLGLKQSGPAS